MKYFIKKVITLIITLLLFTLTFTALVSYREMPPFPNSGVDASPEAIARVRAEYELDQPVLTRYVHWLGKALHGDLVNHTNTIQ